jgi:hypothetical protein
MCSVSTTRKLQFGRIVVEGQETAQCADKAEAPPRCWATVEGRPVLRSTLPQNNLLREALRFAEIAVGDLSVYGF